MWSCSLSKCSKRCLNQKCVRGASPYLRWSEQVKDWRLSPEDYTPHPLPGLRGATILQEATNHRVTGHQRHIRLGENKKGQIVNIALFCMDQITNIPIITSSSASNTRVVAGHAERKPFDAHLQHFPLLALSSLPSMLARQDGVAGFTHFVQLVAIIL